MSKSKRQIGGSTEIAHLDPETARFQALQPVRLVTLLTFEGPSGQGQQGLDEGTMQLYDVFLEHLH